MRPIVFVISFLLFSILGNAQSIRPIRDKVGFCWTEQEMKEVISYLEKDSSKYKNISSENLIASISRYEKNHNGTSVGRNKY